MDTEKLTYRLPVSLTVSRVLGYNATYNVTESRCTLIDWKYYGVVFVRMDDTIILFYIADIKVYFLLVIIYI